MSGIEQVPAAEWEKWANENDALLLDVREPQEWALGTLTGSTKISMTEIMTRVDELDKETPVLCICRSGGRSQQVAAYLADLGFSKVANMAGGVKALGMQD